MMRNQISVLACLALTACGAPSDRLTDQQANAQQGPISGAPGNSADVPPPAGAAPAPDGGAVIYKAGGNEPGWSLTVRQERIDYLGNYGEVRFSEPTPSGFRPGAGNAATRRLRISITPGPCSDGMSDFVYRDTVRIVADGQTFNGCGGGTIPQSSLANSSWTVVAINGRPTGSDANFTLRFSGDRIDATFGCNAIGGRWSQNGDHLATTSLEQTAIGCPEPAASFERNGLAVLRSNVRVEGLTGRRTRLVSEAGSIDLDRGM